VLGTEAGSKTMRLPDLIIKEIRLRQNLVMISIFKWQLRLGKSGTNIEPEGGTVGRRENKRNNNIQNN
jgi:hypothetical protein